MPFGNPIFGHSSTQGSTSGMMIMDSKHPHLGARGEAGRAVLLLAIVLSVIVLVAGGVAAFAADQMPATTAASQPSGSLGGTMPSTAGDAGKAVVALLAAATDLPEDSDSLLGPEAPTRVRVAILNATGKPGGANKVAVLLSEYKRRALEDQIGLQIEVVNLSSAESVRPGQSTLFYRPEFLRAALAMAKAIPGEQFVEPMRPAGMKRAGVDVEIVVGKELP
jgi:hypothetical protein